MALSGAQRRERIVKILANEDGAVAGHLLAAKLEVSRQVIVQDIALLRTAGYAISSTTRGYVLGGHAQAVRLVKVRHGKDRIREEMNAIVDLGGCVIDVMVNHRTYGMVTAPLDVKSRRDVDRFLDNLSEGVSQPLSALTDYYHFHNISAPSEEVLDEIVAALDERGFIAPLTPFEESAF